MSVIGSGSINTTFIHQADAKIAQAAPVQNTWYPVLAATTNVKIVRMSARVQATGEDLEIRVVIDGVTYACAWSAVAGTTYYLLLQASSTAGYLALEGIDYAAANSFILEGRSVAVSIRKTTNAGVGELDCCVVWAKR